MSSTTSLKEFVQEKLAKSQSMKASERDVEKWILDVTFLFDEIAKWLRVADPEEKAFRVARSRITLDEYGYGIYEIQTMQIQFRVPDGGVVTLTPRGINTQRNKTLGLVSMSGPLKKYYLFRLYFVKEENVQPEQRVPTQWIIVDQDTNQSNLLTQQDFEQALQQLLS